MRNTIIDFEYGKVEGELAGPLKLPFIHFESYKWSKTAYLTSLDAWSYILTQFKEYGYKEVFSCIPDDDEKLLKYCAMFGFKPLYHDDNKFIMVCPTGG